MVLCGTIWCMRYGAMWYYMVHAVWCYVVLYGACGMVLCGAIWCMRYGAIWYYMVHAKQAGPPPHYRSAVPLIYVESGFHFLRGSPSLYSTAHTSS
jgi:hypothetical protein